MNAARIVLLLLAVLFLALGVFAGSPDFEGIWIGQAELPDRALDRIVLVLKETGTSVTGTISDGLALIRPETALAGLQTDGKEMEFHFQAADGLSFAFTLKAQGDRMTGWWTDPDGGSGKIELVRKA